MSKIVGYYLATLEAGTQQISDLASQWEAEHAGADISEIEVPIPPDSASFAIMPSIWESFARVANSVVEKDDDI